MQKREKAQLIQRVGKDRTSWYVILIFLFSAQFVGAISCLCCSRVLKHTCATPHLTYHTSIPLLSLPFAIAWYFAKSSVIMASLSSICGPDFAALPLRWIAESVYAPRWGRGGIDSEVRRRTTSGHVSFRGNSSGQLFLLCCHTRLVFMLPRAVTPYTRSITARYTQIG